MNLSEIEIIAFAKEVLEIEITTLNLLENSLNNDFFNTVKAIFNSKGRVIVTGIGKSAIIASKIVATLNSTGTPSIFMHAADAIHGDLGIIQNSDVIICLSKSGNTPEIKVLVPFIKQTHCPLIGMTSDKNSFLGTHSDFILHTPIKKEACPNNLAPTSSTTSQLVMGDALAVCLLKIKKFNSQDFAKYHPGGTLGKRLYLKVDNLLSKSTQPIVSPDDNLKNIITTITSNRLGATAVIKNKKILGIITDGDIRRLFNKNINIETVKAKDMCNTNPIMIQDTDSVVHALEIAKNKNISQLIVTNKNKGYLGIIHIQDILKEGIL